MVAQKPDNRTELIGYGFKKGIKVFFFSKVQCNRPIQEPFIVSGNFGQEKIFEFQMQI
jgi:hypothetical protein